MVHLGITFKPGKFVKLQFRLIWAYYQANQIYIYFLVITYDETILFRKRVAEDHNSNDSNANFKSTNALKQALLDAIEASSNEDFDVLDVLYVVGKTYKDHHSVNEKKSENLNKKQKMFMPKKKRRQKIKRSIYRFEETDATYKYSDKVNNDGYRNSSAKSFPPFHNLYKDLFSSPKAEARRANLFNVPVDDMFLGTFAIPTNQAVAVSRYSE